MYMCILQFYEADWETTRNQVPQPWRAAHPQQSNQLLLGKKKKKSKLQARLEIQVVCTARIGQLLYFLKACEKTKLQKCVSEDEQVSCLLLLFKGSKFPPEAIQYARGITWLADFLLPPRW